MKEREGRRGRDRGQSDELGERAAKYKGLFSEKDWKCDLCGNINWAKRLSCNQCQMPKPGLGKDASREGFGGGYMDRVDVEYKSSRFEDDQEYDDFGRKKKRSKESNGKPAVSKSIIVEEEKNSETKAKPEEEREVDDDDEEGGDDLLGAWADVIGEDEVKQLASKSKSDSRATGIKIANNIEVNLGVEKDMKDEAGTMIAQGMMNEKKGMEGIDTMMIDGMEDDK
ncbi:hypothetical protein HK098_005824 [Nowakowskiella sp. JEL0407]|nr:hypothetical protein HK098_005824 [Nowakowskiella sp. JEL0407]